MLFRSLLSFLFSIFAGLALLLATIGLYGLLAYTTLKRVPEIGIRLALGARPSQIRSLILSHGMHLLLTGSAIGLVGTIAISRALQTERTGFWLIAGVAFGAALLSKYYALLLAPSLLLFLLRSSKYRFWLRRWQPWTALALGLIVFSPVIFWNAHHDWASFARGDLLEPVAGTTHHLHNLQAGRFPMPGQPHHDHIFFHVPYLPNKHPVSFH